MQVKFLSSRNLVIGRLIVDIFEVTHTDKPNSVGHLWTRDRHIAVISTNYNMV